MKSPEENPHKNEAPFEQPGEFPGLQDYLVKYIEEKAEQDDQWKELRGWKMVETARQTEKPRTREPDSTWDRPEHYYVLSTTLENPENSEKKAVVEVIQYTEYSSFKGAYVLPRRVS